MRPPSLAAMALTCLTSAGALGVATPSSAWVTPRATSVPAPEELDSADAPASHYARLDRSECLAELGRRNIGFAVVDEAKGVLVPVRLLGPLHGVSFHTALPPAQRAKSPWEIVDCRLALALDDFAAQLATHDVVEVIHFSMYRPPPSRWPAERIASRHLGGLAIDAASFVKRDGTTLVVERDFHGRIGARTCGPKAAAPTRSTPEGSELRQIVCDAADAKIFHVELTPDFNWAHRNHFHLEVTSGVRWFYVH